MASYKGARSPLFTKILDCSKVLKVYLAAHSSSEHFCRRSPASLPESSVIRSAHIICVMLSARFSLRKGGVVHASLFAGRVVDSSRADHSTALSWSPMKRLMRLRRPARKKWSACSRFSTQMSRISPVGSGKCTAGF